MVGDELRRMGVVFQHAGKFQLQPAQAEIHRGPSGGLDKFGQVVAGPQPGQNAIALPSPRNDFFPREVGIQMPAVFLGIFFNALMQAVIVPPQCQQHSFLFFGHGL